jgi:hypothetical protein
MKKTAKLSAAVFCLAGLAFLRTASADMTRYGFSGINYVPSDEKSFGPDFSAGYFLAVKHQWDEDRYPRGLTLLTSLTSLPVEIGLSNTYSLASGSRDGGFSPQTLGDYVPVVPSIKYALGEAPTPWGQWRMATGFAMPYGAYFVAGFQSTLPYLQPHITAGLSSRYNAYHIFGGMELRVADTHGNPLPLYFTSDFAIGNSLEQLNQVEERFYSVGVRMDAGQHLQLGMVYRADGEYPSLENKGFVAFSVITHFNPLSRRTAK